MPDKLYDKLTKLRDYPASGSRTTDNLPSFAASGAIADSGKPKADLGYAAACFNLVNDPYHLAYARGLAMGTDGRNHYGTGGTWSIGYSYLSPYTTPCMIRTGTGGLFRRFYMDEMGVRAGDIITLVVAMAMPLKADGAGSSNYFTYQFTTADTISTVGAQGQNNNTVQYYSGVTMLYRTRLTIPATAGAISVATRQNSTSVDGGEHVIAWGIFRSPTGPANDPLETYRSILLGPLPERGFCQVNLPRKVYALVGGTGSPTAIEETNLHWSGVASVPPTHTIAAVSTYGRSYADKWRIQPGNTDVTEYNVSATGTQVAVNVHVRDAAGNSVAGSMDASGNVVSTVTTTVELIDKAKTSTLRVLCVGDSYTWKDKYTQQIATVLPGTVTLQGTGTNDDGSHCFEGRNGWTAANYQTGFWSPFLFPSGVSAAAYRGPTELWKTVVNATAGATYASFQKAAAGWGTTPYSYEFSTSTGYPSSPTTGDVVFDETKAVGQRFQQWSGSAWAAMGSQPTLQLDFSKYLTRWASAFSAAPHMIVWELGHNEALAGTTNALMATQLTNYKTATDAFIAAVRVYSSTIKIVIALPWVGSDQDAFGIFGNTSTIPQTQYRYNVHRLRNYILTNYDTDAQQTNGVYVSEAGGNVDPAAVDTTTENRNKFDSTTVTRYANAQHPSDAVGYLQFGDAIAATLQKLRA